MSPEKHKLPKQNKIHTINSPLPPVLSPANETDVVPRGLHAASGLARLMLGAFDKDGIHRNIRHHETHGGHEIVETEQLDAALSKPKQKLYQTRQDYDIRKERK